MGEKDRPVHGRRSLRDVQVKSNSNIDNNLLLELLLEQQRQNREMHELLMSIVKLKFKTDNVKGTDDYKLNALRNIPTISYDSFVDTLEDVELEASFTELGNEIKSDNSISEDLDKLRYIIKEKGVRGDGGF